MKIKSRALIYFLYNPEGVISDYIIYQLQEYKKNAILFYWL